jgi:hypothetical protein
MTKSSGDFASLVKGRMVMSLWPKDIMPIGFELNEINLSDSAKPTYRCEHSPASLC